MEGPRLYLSRDGGTHWTDITPPAAKKLGEDNFYDVYFLDALRGWAVTDSCAGGGGAHVFRTRDAGKTWRISSVGMSVTCAAGAGYNLSFPNAVDGWISHVEPTGPFMEIARTTDGGRTWKVLNRDLLQNQGLLGPIVFNGPTHGWMAATSGQLYETRDGTNWTERKLALPGGYSVGSEAVGLPVFFGSDISTLPLRQYRGRGDGVVQVYLGRARQIDVAFYVTHNGGSTWTQSSLIRGVTTRTLEAFTISRFVPVSFATISTWWVAMPSQHPAFRVTTNAGKTWTTSIARGITPFGIRLPGDIQVQAAISADSARAGVCVNSNGTAFVSADGGSHWHRLRPGS